MANTNITKPFQDLIHDYPDSMKRGTAARLVAMRAYELGLDAGYDKDSEEHAEFVRGQLEDAPGLALSSRRERRLSDSRASERRQVEIDVPDDRRDRAGGGSGSGDKPKLTKEEISVAEASGITPEEYAQHKLTIAEMKKDGYFGMGG